MRIVRRESAIACDDAAQVAAHQRDVRRLDGDVGPRADRDADVGLRERRRVVDAVAHHRDDASRRLQPLDLGDLALRQHAGHDAVDPRLRARPPRPCAALSPVSITTSSPIARAARRSPRASVGLIGSATASRPASAPSTATYTGVFASPASRVAASRSGATSIPRSAHQRLVARRAPRARRHARRRAAPGHRLEIPRRAPARARASFARRTIASASGCSLDDLERRREREQLVARAARAVRRSTTSVTAGRPSVTVPGLVEHHACRRRPRAAAPRRP